MQNIINVANISSLSKKQVFDPFSQLFNEIVNLQGLVAYYPLNELSGNTAINYAPDTKGALNGTITGATVGQDGLVGKAYSFDGVNDEIQVANFTNNLQGLNTISILCLAKLTTDDVDSVIGMRNADTTDSFYILKLNDTQLECRWRDSLNVNQIDLTPTITGLETDWHMFALVANVTTLKCYSNGVEVATSSLLSGTFGDGTNRPFYISNDGNNNFGAGFRQHVAVFNRALSTDEITKLARITGLA